MNPVIGLDVSKGESQVQALLDKGKPYRKSCKISHTVEGVSLLVEFLENVKKETGKGIRKEKKPSSVGKVPQKEVKFI